MIPPEILKKIRRIQIRTSHVVDDLLAGGWHSAFKGRGIEFEEVRPYQIGDDVRTIDWNVTARAGEPFVKLFREERELSVQLLVDISPSQFFGTQTQTKRELVAELGATLAFSAIKNNDKVGLTLFSNNVEKSIPPRKGTRHCLRLIRELLYFEPSGQGTDLTSAIEHLNRTSHRRKVVFLISDFEDEHSENTLKVARRRHEIIPVVVRDERESTMPNVGLVRLRDAETGQTQLIDTSSGRVRRAFEEMAKQRRERLDASLKRMRMSAIYLETGNDFVRPLQQYFHQRELRR
ncbi:hypothetical protein CA13_40060 [Planctomycetes bacterium CA13]|uniref:DUF58 domain-containing protein n=1 Tax=Novipirellula herctigrandis TaxID=2527986 RepID=A0A5C5Z7Q9_9BACT|nr:hypothetical protein CA13_40060 [Planctomycetes bacterium CA13]